MLFRRQDNVRGRAKAVNTRPHPWFLELTVSYPQVSKTCL